MYEKQQKMITFLDNLHRKYKVLQKLTQKQSQAFDSEVILLLVDENQNVDQKLYQDVITNIGIDAFVLDVLEKSMNRSYFCNQYELKKNIGSIADNLEIQAKEVTKKMKIVQRRQAQLNQRQANIKNKLKQHAIQIQKQLINKLTNKQTQVKKNITSLINNIKTKQKILYDRKQEIKQKWSQLLLKQKSLISQKQKESIKKNQSSQVQQNNEQIDVSQHNMRSNNLKQLKEMTKKYQQCKLQLEKFKKKNKTTQMAYSKAKSDIQAKDRDVEKLNQKIQQLRKQLEDEKSRGKLKDKQIVDHNKQMNEIKIENKAKKCAQKLDKQPNRNIANTIECNVQQKHELIDMLELLEISKIVHEDEANDQIKQNCNANQAKKEVSSIKTRKFIENKRKQQNNGLFNKAQVQQCTESKIYMIKQTNGVEQSEQSLVIEHHFMQRRQKKAVNRQTSTSRQAKDKRLCQIASAITNINRKEMDVCQQHEDEKQEVRIPQFLKKQQNNPNQSPSEVLNKIQQLAQSTKDPSESLIKSNLLEKFTQIPFFEHTKKLLVSYFDMLLELIQQSNPNYYQVIQYISKPSFVSFFQISYLSYQANLEIAQATTLLLSRILMMTSAHVQFQNQFVQAIQLRSKLTQGSQSEDNQGQQFLKANINCLLSMIPV